jgi:hypothetical protein
LFHHQKDECHGRWEVGGVLMFAIHTTFRVHSRLFLISMWHIKTKEESTEKIYCNKENSNYYDNNFFLPSFLVHFREPCGCWPLIHFQTISLFKLSHRKAGHWHQEFGDEGSFRLVSVMVVELVTRRRILWLVQQSMLLRTCNITRSKM